MYFGSTDSTVEIEGAVIAGITQLYECVDILVARDPTLQLPTVGARKEAEDA